MPAALPIGTIRTRSGRPYIKRTHHGKMSQRWVVAVRCEILPSERLKLIRSNPAIEHKRRLAQRRAVRISNKHRAMVKRAVISEGRFYPVDHIAKVIVMLSWRTMHQASRWARETGRCGCVAVRGVKLVNREYQEYQREVVGVE